MARALLLRDASKPVALFAKCLLTYLAVYSAPAHHTRLPIHSVWLRLKLKDFLSSTCRPYSRLGT